VLCSRCITNVVSHILLARVPVDNYTNKKIIPPYNLAHNIKVYFFIKRPFTNFRHSMMTTQFTNKAGDPGLSLWLVPPIDSAIYRALSNAIVHIVPPILNVSDSPPQFEPHVTLASRIPKHSITSDPQKWLDALDLPGISTAEVTFQELAVGDTFTKKLFIRCERAESLLELATSCRKHSNSESDGADYDPHVSLV
jgi:hypothetical protein